MAVGAQRGDQFVVDDLHHHLAGGDRLDHGGADRLLADPFGKASNDVERDVRLQQGAPHLAHGRIDIGFRQRAAPRQPIKNATQLFRQIVEQVRRPVALSHPSRRRLRLLLRMRLFQTPLRPRAHRAVGRWPPAS
jgi:hypothetical protein